MSKHVSKPALRTRTLRALTIDECHAVVGGVEHAPHPAGLIMRDTVIVPPPRPTR